MLKDLVEHPAAVIATGGGAILAAENREMMARAGVVVFLNVSVAQQLKELGLVKADRCFSRGTARRPKTADGGTRAALQGAGRCHHLAGGGNARKVARQIEAVLRERGLIPHHDGE